ncbi:MAG TPA: hypothetical protein VFU56_05200 [Gaiellaceae bacterium]|nr:hypothetical protein [Gaiellaceae bacterium]
MFLRPALKLVAALVAVVVWIVVVPVVDALRSAVAFVARPFSRLSR